MVEIEALDAAPRKILSCIFLVWLFSMIFSDRYATLIFLTHIVPLYFTVISYHYVNPTFVIAMAK